MEQWSIWDKGGGITITNTHDYVKEMEEMLKAKFSHDGHELPFYVKANERLLKEKQKEFVWLKCWYYLGLILKQPKILTHL